MPEQTLEIPLRSQEDVVGVRQKVRALAVEIGLNLIDQTKIVTAASELARNTSAHPGVVFAWPLKTPDREFQISSVR